MKIFFGASTAEIIKYHEYYFSIREFLIEEGHVLTRDWLPITYKYAKKNKRIKSVENIYEAVMRAVSDSELVIIEDTISGFSTGHQITMALQRQKPTLVLWQKSKKMHFNKGFIEGIKSDYLEVTQYDLKNYKEIIRAFINKYSKATQKHRFHLVIDEVERKYIEWAKFQKGKSRTKIIRQAIRKEIREDEEYQDYLKFQKAA